MTSTPSLPAQIEAVRHAIARPKNAPSPTRDYAQEDRDEWQDACLRAVLVTLQQHERLEDELRGACLDRDSYKARVKQLDDACQRFMREVALLRERHERLEAAVKAARDLLRYDAGIKHPGADVVIVSRERVHTLEDALAAVDTAAPETPPDMSPINPSEGASDG